MKAFSNSGTEENLPPPRERALFPILVAQADAQWQQFNPKLYRQLKQEGRLKPALKRAAETTLLEWDQLTAKGLADDQARELAMQNILLPPESRSRASRPVR